MTAILGRVIITLNCFGTLVLFCFFVVVVVLFFLLEKDGQTSRGGGSLILTMVVQGTRNFFHIDKGMENLKSMPVKTSLIGIWALCFLINPRKMYQMWSL